MMMRTTDWDDWQADHGTRASAPGARRMAETIRNPLAVIRADADLMQQLIDGLRARASEASPEALDELEAMAIEVAACARMIGKTVEERPALSLVQGGASLRAA